MEAKLVDILCEIKAETKLAYLLTGIGRHPTGVWVPKQHCEWDKKSSTMTMPEWLAEQKELL